MFSLIYDFHKQHGMLLPLNLLLLLLPHSTGQQCAHFSHDVLISRFESHILECLGSSISPITLSTLIERFAVNDFDRHQPLALVLFSNPSDVLHTLSGSVASSLFGASRSPQTVQSIDFQELLEFLRTSNFDIRQTIRVALATPLDACPGRNLFVLDNVQALDDAALPVLDLFLDPLNGKRAQYQHYVEGKTDRVYDCTNSVFLFLYKVRASRFPVKSMMSSNHWREYLVQQWTRSEGTIEEFTPEAFVGRLSDGVAVFLPGDDDSIDATFNQFKESNEWRQLCDVQLHDMEDKAIEVVDSTKIYASAALAVVAETVAAKAFMISRAIAMISIPAFLVILTRAKRWNGDTTKQRKRGTIHRRSSGSNNTRYRKKKVRK